jgi:uncharacterized SAM-binding protein YcdF (DUF218 family)
VNPEQLKPIFAALVLPPAGPILITFLGFLLRFLTRQHKKGVLLLIVGLALSWALSCHVSAQLLNRWLLKDYPTITATQTVQFNSQAIVVLGSGMQAFAPEYGGVAQLSRWSVVRLRYGTWLSRQTGVPLAFSGGQGWSIKNSVVSTEADAARYYLASIDQPAAKWLDNASADTEQNAAEIARLFKPAQIKRIVLVTHAWHMERAVALFTAQGFEVLAAPVQPIGPKYYDLLNLLPSAEGLEDTRHVLREALALLVLKAKHRFQE